jgi:hypothetical protein
MKQSQSQQHNDDVILLVIAIIYTLLTLLTQLISELWHSSPEQHHIAEGHWLRTSSPKMKVTQQYPADVDYQDAPKGVIPCTGNVYKNKKGVLRCYWIPTGGNYSSEEQDELTGWYDVPDLEDIEEWTFDSVCLTPAGDEVEPDASR